MPIGKKQLQRLIRLVAQLKENRYPNCASLASDMRRADLEDNLNLACTPKTIFRDIQTLKNDFDAPIRFDKSRNGYYLAHHGWTFSCPRIHDDAEMLAAVLGARVAEHIFPEPLRGQIRDAVDDLLTGNNLDSLVILPANRTKIAAEVFLPVFQAWQKHELCRIEYVSGKGERSVRDFEPHALVFFDGIWYAKGFCRAKKEMRTLVLSRMTAATRLGKSFTPDPEIIKTANEEGIFDPEMVRDVVVECDAYLTNIIPTRPLHPEQKIERTADGGCRIRVAKMSKYRLITWVMHQCGRASVSSPRAVRNDILAFANKIMERSQN